MFRHSIFAFLFLVSTLAKADITKNEGWWDERWKNIKSPFTTDAKYILLGGAVVVGILILADDSLIDETNEELTEKKLMSKAWSNAADNYGQDIPNALYFVGMGTYGYFSKNQIAMKRAWMMFEATLYSGASVISLKKVVHEKRPNPNKTYDSFPSGHTASAFTFASMVQAEHGWIWGSAAYAGALLTGFQRQADDKHYLHDVIAGAAIGAAFGYGVSWANRGNDKLALAFVPTGDGGYARIGYDF